MADVPLNEKLYALVVSQAKAKYRIYPSPGASHWVHRRYLELGGRFEDSAKVAERKRMIAKFIEIMPAFDSLKFREYSDEIEPGIDLEVDVEGPSGTFRSPFTIGLNFFWPNARV